MNYKILDINQDQKWVSIEVDFADGSPKYAKKMMADTSNEDGIKASVEGWLSDYLPQREVSVKPNLSSLKNKIYPVDATKLSQKNVPAEAVE